MLKLVILGHFLPFYPLKTQKIKILKNEKSCWRYYHFTSVYQNSQSYDVQFLEILSFYKYMCTINKDHMIYGSSNIRCNRQKFLSLWAIFCPFSPMTTWKIKLLKLKKHLEILSFYKFAP